MKSTNQLIGCCGLDCEKCEARIATITNDNALREKAGIALDDFSYRFKKSHGSLLLKNMQRCVAAQNRLQGFAASAAKPWLKSTKQD